MLTKRGASEETFRAFLVEPALINQYKDKLLAELAVDDEALKNYYKGHVETFAESEQLLNSFYVVNVEKREARIRDFEEVKAEISKEILGLRKNKALDEWCKSASREAKIEYVH